MHRETMPARIASVALAVLVAVANLVALVSTLGVLLNARPEDGISVLLAALQVWVTNLIACALVLWELDRGGPVRRRNAKRADLPPADYRFPQDEDEDTSREVAEQSAPISDWRPGFQDYLYEAAVFCMAFSPGAGVPLRPRTKMILIIHSFAAFVLLVLVIAHAVGQLGG